MLDLYSVFYKCALQKNLWVASIWRSLQPMLSERNCKFSSQVPAEIWRCHLAAYVKELHWSACRTSSRINFLHSTNQIIIIWPRRSLPSAFELREPSSGDVLFISPVTDHNTKYYYFRVECVLRDEAYDLSPLSENRKPTHFVRSTQSQHLLHNYLETLGIGPIGLWIHKHSHCGLNFNQSVIMSLSTRRLETWAQFFKGWTVDKI